MGSYSHKIADKSKNRENSRLKRFTTSAALRRSPLTSPGEEINIFRALPMLQCFAPILLNRQWIVCQPPRRYTIDRLSSYARYQPGSLSKRPTCGFIGESMTHTTRYCSAKSGKAVGVAYSLRNLSPYMSTRPSMKGAIPEKIK